MPTSTTLIELLDEIKALDSVPAVQLNLGPIDAWCLMGELQLACKHPLNIGLPREVAETVARGIQRELATTPALQKLAEAGWTDEYDYVDPGRAL